jgi:hypothetical protein
MAYVVMKASKLRRLNAVGIQDASSLSLSRTTPSNLPSLMESERRPEMVDSDLFDAFCGEESGFPNWSR